MPGKNGNRLDNFSTEFLIPVLRKVSEVCFGLVSLLVAFSPDFPVRCPPRPSQSMHFGDVSETNGLKDTLAPRDSKVMGNAQ